MAEQLYMKKHLGALRPADRMSENAFASLPREKLLRVEVKQPRNPAHHRLFWALCNLIYENQSKYPSPRAIERLLLLATGRVTWLQSKKFGAVPDYQSISFAKMDQREFSEFFDECTAFIREELLPGVTNKELMAEIEAMIGEPA